MQVIRWIKKHRRLTAITTAAVLILVVIFAVRTMRTHIRMTHCPKQYSTGKLAGKTFDGLLTQFTGLRGEVPKTARIDFCGCLGNLWAQKQHRSGRNPVVAKTANRLLDQYRPSEGTSLRRYANHIDLVVDRARSDLDWGKVAQIEHLNGRRLKVLKKIAESLTGEDFLAYSMTELMPTTNGDFNAQVYEFMLYNAGPEYIESIPALYDPLTSFGPYQFTQYAWYDAGGVRRGGSRLNVALSRYRISHGSVTMLQGDEHHIAAFLFALDNVAHLVHGLKAKQIETLERQWEGRHAEIVQFIATAHNYPAGAQHAAIRWLSSDAKHQYIVSCSPKGRRYAQKTGVNLAALQ